MKGNLAKKTSSELLLEVDGKIAELSETKVDKVTGKDLSTEDYTTGEKEKLGRYPEFPQQIETDQYTSLSNSVSTLYAMKVQTLTNGTLEYSSENYPSSAVLIDFVGPVSRTATSAYSMAENTMTMAGQASQLVPKFEFFQNNDVSVQLEDKYEYRNLDIWLTSMVLTSSATFNLGFSCNIVFRSPGEPTTIAYSIIDKWVGDDCDSDGVFIPASDTDYMIEIKNIGGEGSAAYLLGRVTAFHK